MISCIAIDDEPLALNLMKEYISKVSFLDMKASFTDAVEATAWLEKEKVDLVFLDIQMPDINGIQFYNSMAQKPMVIFTTAYKGYAVEGFADADATQLRLSDLLTHLPVAVLKARFNGAIKQARKRSRA